MHNSATQKDSFAQFAVPKRQFCTILRPKKTVLHNSAPYKNRCGTRAGRRRTCAPCARTSAAPWRRSGARTSLAPGAPEEAGAGLCPTVLFPLSPVAFSSFYELLGNYDSLSIFLFLLGFPFFGLRVRENCVRGERAYLGGEGVRLLNVHVVLIYIERNSSNCKKCSEISLHSARFRNASTFFRLFLRGLGAQPILSCPLLPRRFGIRSTCTCSGLCPTFLRLPFPRSPFPRFVESVFIWSRFPRFVEFVFSVCFSRAQSAPRVFPFRRSWPRFFFSFFFSCPRVCTGTGRVPLKTRT